MPPYPARKVGGSVYLAEDDDLFLGVPVEGVRVVDEVAQHLRVVCGGHDEGFFGPVIQDQLVGELAVLELSLVAPVGVDVGDLPDLSGLLGVLLAQGQPPRVGVVDGVLRTHPTSRLTHANNGEPPTREVARTPLPRTPVNKGAESLSTCLRPVLRACQERAASPCTAWKALRVGSLAGAGRKPSLVKTPPPARLRP